MNGNGTVELKGPMEQVFRKLLDPEILAECIMGCKKLEQVEEGTYKADLSIGIAAVKGKYDATIKLEDVQPPRHYQIVVHGEGGPGIVDAVGIIDLEPLNENETLLKYTYHAEVGGKVAAIGQRMLGGIAKLLIGDFFKKLGRQVENA